MYFYYMMSAMGPQYQKYLWWKKYMTELQIVSTFINLHAQILFLYSYYTEICIIHKLFNLKSPSINFVFIVTIF